MEHEIMLKIMTEMCPVIWQTNITNFENLNNSKNNKYIKKLALKV